MLREGYGFADFRADVIAGLTVAIVALPLSMAIAIASGVTPDRGLYTAVVGGFIVSLLGGSRFQVGGPAGAFIVLVAVTVERHGVDGVILATMMAGVFLIAAGLLRLGTYIKFIPYPVTVGFTAGIAVIIFASQLKDLLGITLAGKEPGELIPKLAGARRAACTPPMLRRSRSLPSASPSSSCLRQLRPDWPGILIAVVVAALATWALSLPVETIGTPLRRHSARIAAAGAAGILAREGAGRAARCDRLRAARRDRVAAVGGGRRRHDRPPPSLQLRTGGARRRQYRLGAVRRHLRHRHRSRAPRPMSAPARAARSPACCIRCSCCCSC